MGDSLAALGLAPGLAASLGTSAGDPLVPLVRVGSPAPGLRPLSPAVVPDAGSPAVRGSSSRGMRAGSPALGSRAGSPAASRGPSPVAVLEAVPPVLEAVPPVSEALPPLSRAGSPARGPRSSSPVCVPGTVRAAPPAAGRGSSPSSRTASPVRGLRSPPPSGGSESVRVGSPARVSRPPSPGLLPADSSASGSPALAPDSSRARSPAVTPHPAPHSADPELGRRPRVGYTTPEAPVPPSPRVPASPLMPFLREKASPSSHAADAPPDILLGAEVLPGIHPGTPAALVPLGSRRSDSSPARGPSPVRGDRSRDPSPSVRDNSPSGRPPRASSRSERDPVIPPSSSRSRGDRSPRGSSSPVSTRSFGNGSGAFAAVPFTPRPTPLLSSPTVVSGLSSTVHPPSDRFAAPPELALSWRLGASSSRRSPSRGGGSSHSKTPRSSRHPADNDESSVVSFSTKAGKDGRESSRTARISAVEENLQQVRQGLNHLTQTTSTLHEQILEVVARSNTFASEVQGCFGKMGETMHAQVLVLQEDFSRRIASLDRSEVESYSALTVEYASFTSQVKDQLGAFTTQVNDQLGSRDAKLRQARQDWNNKFQSAFAEWDGRFTALAAGQEALNQELTVRQSRLSDASLGTRVAQLEALCKDLMKERETLRPSPPPEDGSSNPSELKELRAAFRELSSHMAARGLNRLSSLEEAFQAQTERIQRVENHLTPIRSEISILATSVASLRGTVQSLMTVVPQLEERLVQCQLASEKVPSRPQGYSIPSVSRGSGRAASSSEGESGSCTDSRSYSSRTSCTSYTDSSAHSVVSEREVHHVNTITEVELGGEPRFPGVVFPNVGTSLGTGYAAPNQEKELSSEEYFLSPISSSPRPARSQESPGPSRGLRSETLPRAQVIPAPELARKSYRDYEPSDYTDASKGHHRSHRDGTSKKKKKSRSRQSRDADPWSASERDRTRSSSSRKKVSVPSPSSRSRQDERELISLLPPRKDSSLSRSPSHRRDRSEFRDASYPLDRQPSRSGGGGGGDGYPSYSSGSDRSGASRSSRNRTPRGETPRAKKDKKNKKDKKESRSREPSSDRPSQPRGRIGRLELQSIPYFDGEPGTDVHHWIHRLETVVQQSGQPLSECSGIAAMRTKAKSEAESWFFLVGLKLPRPMREQPWPWLRNQLIQRFGMASEGVDSLRALWQNQKCQAPPGGYISVQVVNSHCDRFCTRLYALNQQGDCPPSDSDINQTFVASFPTRFQDELLKVVEEFHGYAGVTFDALVARARSFAVTEGRRQSMKTGSGRHVVAAVTEQVPVKGGPSRPAGRGPSGDSRPSSPQGRSSASTPAPGGNPSGGRGRGKRSPFVSTPQCFQCAGWGHVSRACTRPVPRCMHCKGAHMSELCEEVKRIRQSMDAKAAAASSRPGLGTVAALTQSSAGQPPETH